MDGWNGWMDGQTDGGTDAPERKGTADGGTDRWMNG